MGGSDNHDSLIRQLLPDLFTHALLTLIFRVGNRSDADQFAPVILSLSFADHRAGGFARGGGKDEIGIHLFDFYGSLHGLRPLYCSSQDLRIKAYYPFLLLRLYRKSGQADEVFCTKLSDLFPFLFRERISL